MLKRIVVGTDGSAPADKAVDWAAELARISNAEVLLVHVFETDPAALPGGYVVLPQEELDRMREATGSRLAREWSKALQRSGTRWRPILLEGSPAGGLLDLADREDADLIVVGSRGRGGFAQLLLGSVGHHLTQHASIPVVIVPSR